MTMLQPIVDCVVLLLVARLLLTLANWLWDYYFTVCCRDKTSSLPLPPGSMGWPIVGESIQILKDPNYSENQRKTHGNIYRSHFLGVPVIRICGGSNLKKVLQGEGDYVCSRYPTSIRTLVGDNSLIGRSGQSHADLQKVVRKCFSHDALEGYIPHVQAELQDQLLTRWCDKLGDFTAWEECRRLLFKLACYSMAGFKCNDDEVDCFYKSFIKIAKGFWTVPLALPGTTYSDALTAQKRLREKIKQKLQEETDNPNSVLRQILESYEESCDEETCLQLCMELMLFGHETTSGAFTALISQLAKHPHVVRSIRAELDEHYSLDATTSGPLTLKTLNKLKYVDSVVKESLRILPPVAGVFRRVLKTFDLEGYQIPKDWYVVCLIKDTHASTEAFSDKTTFNPDRWLCESNNNNYLKDDEGNYHNNNGTLNYSDKRFDSVTGNVYPRKRQTRINGENEEIVSSCPMKANVASKCPYECLPYGRGKRMCVGKDYANMILKLITIELVRNCDWTVHNPNPVFMRTPSLVPLDGLPVTFRRLLKTTIEE